MSERIGINMCEMIRINMSKRIGINMGEITWIIMDRDYQEETRD